MRSLTVTLTLRVINILGATQEVLNGLLVTSNIDIVFSAAI